MVTNWGVLVINSGGNDRQNVLSHDVVPCTRTRVLCVGATNLADNQRADYSNWGNSIRVWAPGGNVVADMVSMPDPSTGGATRLVNGTSFAAPFVSGVAAMMLALNPQLTTDQIIFHLMESSWRDSPDPNVPRYLNAYEAVRRAANYQLPKDAYDAAGDNGDWTRATPFSVTIGNTDSVSGIISNPADEDWYRVSLPTYFHSVMNIDHVPSLGSINADPLTAGSNVLDTGPQTSTYQALPNGRIRQTIMTPLAAPGDYYIRVSGSSANAYEVNFTAVAVSLAADAFEPNDSQESAREVNCRQRVAGNLHADGDVDFYKVALPDRPNLAYSFTLVGSDTPINVAFVEQGGESFALSSSGQSHIARPGVYSIRVDGRGPTRYELYCTQINLDPALRGGLLERFEIKPLSPGDPIEQWVRMPDEYWLFHHEAGLREISIGRRVRVELLEPNGRPTGIQARFDRGEQQLLRLSLERLTPGKPYVLKASREPNSVGRVPIEILPIRLQ